MRRRTADTAHVKEPGISRRGLLQRFALLLLGAPLLRLSETVARAERRRRHHSGDDHDIWIGHC